ncbi:helix-turn-helix domain-containing protein [Flavitalea flava]
MNKIPIRHIPTAQKEPAFSERFSIRDIHDVLAEKDMIQELHRHNFYYILVLKKGKGNHEIDFTPYTIGDHTVFFMRPGQVHRLLLNAGSTGYLIQFRDEFYFPYDKNSTRQLRKASSINHYLLNPERLQKLLSISAYIFQEYVEKQGDYQEVIKANMCIFFIELIRQQTGNPSSTGNLYLQDRLEEFLKLLETPVVKHRQVAHYAALLHLSIYQLNAITKAILGKTCSELINEYSIMEAKRYLRATSDQINQIAGHLGYEDVSYFIRFFKKHTGHSPEAFRHNSG